MNEDISTFRHEAMATYFEARIAGRDAAYAGEAARAAFAVVDRVEGLLSRFRESSEISRINSLACGEIARVSPECLECLEQSLELQVRTRGAFNPAYAGSVDRGQVLLDRESLAVAVDGPPVFLDLGAIGKGYALDAAARELRDWDISRALLVAGGSSLLALGGPAEGTAWDVSLGGVHPARRIGLEHRGLGSSGTAVKGSHIIDPRTGAPAQAAHRTWAVAPSAAAADALSTAWMILSQLDIAAICAEDPAIGAVVQREANGGDLWIAGNVEVSG